MKQDELFRRIEQADNGINENINAKYDAIDASLRTEAERNRLRMEALMKRAYPEDSPAEIRRRIFPCFQKPRETRASCRRQTRVLCSS